jgi:tRNA G18 (ribose-2'-O)-methylase SpoU
MRKLTMPELNRLSAEDFRNAEKFPLVVVLDNIRSQSNTGSVFRTADAFRVKELILCGITATPPHREIHKTALGATETVDWRYMESTVIAVNQLKADGYTIIALEQAEGSCLLQDFLPHSHSKIAIILGNEINGISDEVMEIVDGCIEIPQSGTKHSLNVSVAAGIVIWDLVQKMKISRGPMQPFDATMRKIH